MLPNIMCAQEGGAVRLTWICQYDGIKAVIVKRSYDSSRNYNQIGTVGEVAKGVQTFVDERPIVGRSFYKVSVVFKSGLNWASNYCCMVFDSANVPDSMRQHAGGAVEPRIKFKLAAPEVDLDAAYVEAMYVRVNRTTGHVDVQLPDDFGEHAWSVVFYNGKKQAVMDVPKIKAKNIVIDKRNFQRRGRYKFELRRDEEMFEWGYVRIE